MNRQFRNLRQNVLLAAALMLASTLHGQTWPQWRGPQRDGHVQDFSLPATWPDSLQRVWRITVGAGLSSPVVAEEKVFLLTREGEDEMAACYNLADGKQVWRQTYISPFIPNPQAVITRYFPSSQGKGPFATPILHKGYLYTLGVDRVLSCFAAKTGALQWRKQFLKQQVPDKLVYECPSCGCSEDGKKFDQPGECTDCRMGLSPIGMETSASSGGGNYYGAAASPLIEGKLGIVNIGNLNGGEMIAFDLRTGEEKWRSKSAPPSSSSPVMAELFGVRQVIVLTRENLMGLEVKNGRQLWSFALESNAQVVTPIVFEDLVIFSAYRSPTTAVRIKKAGSTWSADTAWSTNEVTLYTSTPVLVGDKLYGLSYANRGQFFALDARSGKVDWTSDGRQAQGAAILRVGATLWALTDEAKLGTMECNAQAYHPLKNYQLAESPMWAHPVLWGKNILVKDETNLTLWRME